MEEVSKLPDVSQDETKPVKQDRKKVERKKRVEKIGEKFMPDEFEEFGSNWIPEDDGDTIEGYVQPSEDYLGEFGPVKRVLIGQKRVFCGAGLRDLPTLEGKYVRITYQGKQKSTKKGHQDFRKFSVLVRKEE
jgi:hypothetical protein